MTASALAFPLKATFRILTLSPEVRVENARGELLLQVKQKLLTLREATTVFADEAKTVPVYKMLADRVIGFRAVHRITRASDGAPIGAVKAGGLRTIWQARYEVTDAQDKLVFKIREENPWIKVIDALVDEIPLVGPIIAMFINPRYLVEDEGGTLRYRITKKRSFVERNFMLEQISPDAHVGIDERLIALALIQAMMLERSRD
jgi:uncharacterized protein YxjI